MSEKYPKPGQTVDCPTNIDITRTVTLVAYNMLIQKIGSNDQWQIASWENAAVSPIKSDHRIITINFTCKAQISRSADGNEVTTPPTCPYKDFEAGNPTGCAIHRFLWGASTK